MGIYLSKFIEKKSSSVVILLILVLIVFRTSNVSERETSWDVLGYYLPLPATIIYDDPLMEDRAWIEKINEEKQLTGTLYQISSTPDGKPMYFFLLGMAFLYLPFFLIGHGSAYILGYPLDGFSLPYQYAMVIGGLFYTIIGLIYLRKILLHYLSDSIASIVLIIIVLATNYSHHLSLKNLETVNVLFMFVCLVIWNTIKWHETHRLKNLLAIGAFITLMSLVKPSEILIALIPLLYGVFSVKTLQEKIKLIISNKGQFLWMLLLCLLIAMPQMAYWYSRTGKFFYDSYINPGVGLDIFSPYILESLFSYKKGWLIYTPVMILSLLGFYYLIKNFKKSALSFTLYFLVSAYIIFSWTEWWYGAGFSNRPLITVYPILAITLGLFIDKMLKKSNLIKYTTILFIVFCLLLNQFQWWQLRNGILEPYRTTKEYYWASFLKTSVTSSDKDLLTVYRDFDGEHTFEDKFNYRVTYDTTKHFAEIESAVFAFTPEVEFLPLFEEPYSSITDKDHLWVEVEILFRNKDSNGVNSPLIVTTMERKEGAYGYYTKKISYEISQNKDFHIFTSQYLTPSIRSRKDNLKIYLWNKDRINLDIGRVKIKFYERK